MKIVEKYIGEGIKKPGHNVKDPHKGKMIFSYNLLCQQI